MREQYERTRDARYPESEFYSFAPLLPRQDLRAGRPAHKLIHQFADPF
jgi:hypothetical protein